MCAPLSLSHASFRHFLDLLRARGLVATLYLCMYVYCNERRFKRVLVRLGLICTYDVNVYVCVGINSRMNVSMHICMYVCIFVCMYASMYVCMYVCM